MARHKGIEARAHSRYVFPVKIAKKPRRKNEAELLDHATNNLLSALKKASKPTKSAKDYPRVTHGSQVTARGRQKANKMTDTQRDEYFRRGMVLIYGGQLPEKTVAGHKRSV